MRKIIYLFLLVAVVAGCGQRKQEFSTAPLPQSEIAIFSSTDKALEDAYEWARKMALSYSHDGTDSVGYWYEAALPQREAFCMRDVAHQTVGAQVLGLANHNRNMLMRFAENISESKDWCTYWEINRYNCPAPADYTNDDEFWYNLNANFDVIQACWKLYEWTGDSTYLHDPCMTNFYDKSLNEYVERWKLQPDSIMHRPQFMNSPAEFDPHNNFHTCRGLASYVENFPGLTASADLISTLYAGHRAAAQIASARGNKQEQKRYENLALQYRTLLEERWWNKEADGYQTFWTTDQKFHRAEGESHILWFGVTEQPERIRATANHLLAKEWNIENQSYLPTLFYRLGYDEAAYKKLVSLPRMNRAEYPEVSFGVVEGVAGGAMGIQPSASEGRITTLSRLPEHSAAKLKNVPVFDGYITVEHNGRRRSSFTNHTGNPLLWRAAFHGEQSTAHIANKEYKCEQDTDILGNTISYIEIEVPAGVTQIAEF